MQWRALHWDLSGDERTSLNSEQTESNLDLKLKKFDKIKAFLITKPTDVVINLEWSSKSTNIHSHMQKLFR